MTRLATTPKTLLAVALALPLAGCSGYTLTGRVVEGDASWVAVVSPDDPALTDARGVGGVRLHLQLDPGRLSRETLAETTSAPDGSFTLEVDRFGAGLLEYDVGLFARRAGYAPTDGLAFRLPPDSKALLVMMSPGADRDTGERPSYEADLDRYRW